MDIQIENLSLKELVALHDKIARRMWELGRTELAAKLGEFQIGDQVSFQAEGKTITGIVIRVNRKSLSVRSQENYFYVPPWAVTKNS
ncbi:MAG: mechanosensitive ion channel domain-containing protein [Candidatus Omnitrophota bacterium]